MQVVSRNMVGYSGYVGDVSVMRKGKTIKFERAKNYDEYYKLIEKQTIEDGDRIVTGKKSVIIIMGRSKDDKLQSVNMFPESELVIHCKDWEQVKGDEKRIGQEMSKIELVKGVFSVSPADAEVTCPFAEIENADDKDPTFIVDIVDEFNVVIPGVKLKVTNKSTGKSYETFPPWGMIGLAELVVTRNGIYEKSMEWIDKRVTAIQSASGIFANINPDFMFEESSMEYSNRKLKEGEKSMDQYDYLKDLDVEKMKDAKMSPEQIEFAKMMAQQYKSSGKSPQTFAFGMLQNMDFEKLMNMPGITPEQREQMKQALPQMKKIQEEFKGGKGEQLKAQMDFSKRYTETAAGDPVIKKNMQKKKAEAQTTLDEYSLPPYPKLLERYKVA